MRAASPSRRQSRLPGLLPMLYFGLAHLSLLVAFAEVAIEPQKVAGFFYHPRMIAVVHLITLGWISSSILGALHLVGPMALRTPMPARRIDYWAFVAYLSGSTGVISHFWIEEFSGVAWSGLLVTLVFLHVGRKLLGPLRHAPVPREVKLGFALAFVNIGLAALVGTVLGLNKYFPFLPGHALTHTFAHAHLAALGWATMMVFAAGVRLMPMFLPSAMPSGRWVGFALLLLQVGTLGVFISFLTQSPWLAPATICVAAGIATFFSLLGWMKRHPRPAPKALVRPDFGVIQALSAFLYLAIACALGLILVFSPDTTPWTLRLTLVYGVCGLVGFLSQIVVGIGARLLPIFAHLVATDWSDTPPTPHQIPDRRLQAATFALWTLGVPVLAAGFYLEATRILAAGGWILLAAALAGTASNWAILRAARESRAPDATGQSAG